MNLEFFFNYMLQNKLEVIKEALKAELPKSIVNALLLTSFLSFSVFGFLIGSSHGIIQGLVSCFKLPMLFYITCIICFPTLYIFLSLLGIKTTLKGIAQFSVLALSIMSIILIAFAPVSLFFLVIRTDYQIFKLINVGMMSIAGFSGVYLFKKHILINAPEDLSEISRTRINRFVLLWLMMFGLIGTNLGFVISPIFGDPSAEFMWFTNASQNFFSHILSIFQTN